MSYEDENRNDGYENYNAKMSDMPNTEEMASDELAASADATYSTLEQNTEEQSMATENATIDHAEQQSSYQDLTQMTLSPEGEKNAKKKKASPVAIVAAVVVALAFIAAMVLH